MGKRLKKMLPSKQPIAVPLTINENILNAKSYEGAQFEPVFLASWAQKIQENVAQSKLEVILAKDMKLELLYSNFENIRRITRLIVVKEDRVIIECFSEAYKCWLRCEVGLSYPITLNTTGLPSIPVWAQKRPKEGSMSEKRKHEGVSGKVVSKKKPSSLNEKTGRKAGSIGDRVGLALLSFKTEEKQFEAAKEAVRESFKADGKDTSAANVESKARAWVSYLRRDYPKLYPSVEVTPKELKATEKPKAEKVAAAKATKKSTTSQSKVTGKSKAPTAKVVTKPLVTSKPLVASKPTTVSKQKVVEQVTTPEALAPEEKKELADAPSF